MKRFLAILLSLSLVLALAACGKSEAPSVDIPDPKGADPVETTEGTEPADSSVDKSVPLYDDQLQLMADNADVWLSEDGFGQTLYAVTDLDENGRYELISSLTQGTGQFTTLNFYEVSEDKQSLVPVAYDYGKEHSEPDMSLNSTVRCFSNSDGNYFVVSDYLRNGYAENYYITEWLRLKDGKVDVEPIAYCSVLVEHPVDGAEDEFETNIYYYTGGDSTEVDLDREGYKNAANEHFDGYERRICNLMWTQISGDASDSDEIKSQLKTSLDGFSFSDDVDLFDTLQDDPESFYVAEAAYPKEYLIGEWSVTHIGGLYDMQTADELSADSTLSVLGTPDDCKAFFGYSNPTDARGAFLLTEMPVYDSDGYEAPAEGEFHVEFYTDNGLERFNAEVDPDDGSLWVTWYHWEPEDAGGDPEITFLRYVKAEG